MAPDDRLTALLEGREAAGPVRWPAAPGGVPAAARAAGWRVVELDLAGVADKAGFMARCADHLTLPEGFGRNWDALRDLLTDTGWLPAGSHTLVLVTGWHTYRAAAPGEWRSVERVLTGAADRARRTARALLVLLAEPPVTDRAHPTPGTSG